MSKLVKYFTYDNFYKLQFQWGHGPLWACCSAQSVAEIIRLFQLLQLLIDITTFLGERVIKTTLCNALLYTFCSLQFYTHTQIHFYSGSCSYNLSIFWAYLISILCELSKQILGCLLFSVSNFCRWQICCWRKRLTWLGWVRQIYIIYFVLTRISVNPIFEKLRPGHVALSFDLGLFCFLEYSSSLSFGNYWGMNMLLHTWLAGAVWHQEVDNLSHTEQEASVKKHFESHWPSAVSPDVMLMSVFLTKEQPSKGVDITITSNSHMAYISLKLLCL